VYPRCPALVDRSRRFCPAHARQEERRRGTAPSRGYNYEWNQLSRRFRERFPLCGMKADGTSDTEHSICAREGRVTAAECVQHLTPFRGLSDPLRLDESNLMSSCFKCNDTHRALKEPGAFGR
jgi:5-methylcytosine-specific restriction protein A